MSLLARAVRTAVAKPAVGPCTNDHTHHCERRAALCPPPTTCPSDAARYALLLLCAVPVPALCVLVLSLFVVQPRLLVALP